MPKKYSTDKEGHFRSETAQPPSDSVDSKQVESGGKQNTVALSCVRGVFDDARVDMIHESETKNQFGKTVVVETIVDTTLPPEEGLPSPSGEGKVKTILH